MHSDRTKLKLGFVPCCISILALATQASSKSSPSVPIVEGGRVRATIIMGEGGSQAYRYAASELQKYLRQLSGAELRIILDSQITALPKHQTLIFVGGPAINPIIASVAEKLGLNLNSLKPGGFVIRTSGVKDHPAVIVAGRDGFSTMYGVYDLVERLGVTFLLTGDIVPSQRDTLSIPELHIRLEPAFPRRGFLLQNGGYENLTLFSYDDYAKLIDQMAKMKCNYVQFWWFPFEPWLKYSYKSEMKWMGDVSTAESGYLTWAHGGFGSRTTDDVSIGKSWFKGRRIAPPEMQNVETPDQAFSVAQSLLSRIIHHAHERGIEMWLAIEIAALPPNLARYCERVGELPFHNIVGTFVQPLDPVNREIQTNRLRALFTTYPEADGYFMVFSEVYPEINTSKYRSYFDQMRPKFFQVRDLRWPWVMDIPESSDRVVDSNIGYFDLFKYLLERRDEINPQAKIGLMGIGRGYALPVFDKLLPKDIPFTDMESSGVWTPAGVPMQDFGGMGERERTIEPRVDDDVNMMGMQFNVTQYSEKDRILSEGIKVGLSGFAAQANRVRGTETNSRFLAEAGWDPKLTVEDFYKSYSQRLFGPAASPDMYNAFMALEKNETHLGYYNYDYSTMNCCAALFEVTEAYEYSQQPNAYDGPNLPDWKQFIIHSQDTIVRYEGSMRLLDEALQRMRAALPKSAPQGRYELRYMINRTESYRDYIQSLVTIRKAYLLFDRSFQEKPNVTHQEFVSDLEKSLSAFQSAEEQMRTATQEYAELIDNPSDLGVLYHLNVRGILGFSLVRLWMQNVLNFQEGKPYLEPVGWEKLFFPYHYAIAQ